MERNLENRIVKVKKAAILPNLACKICDELVDDATAIDECLHLFCKKCIYDKILEEDLQHCPVCNLDLGPEPLEKLRKDRAIQSLIEKLFPQKESKVNAANAGTSKATTNDTDKEDQDVLSLLDISNMSVANTGQSVFPCDQESQKIDHEETKNDVMEVASDEGKSFNSDVKGSKVEYSKRNEKNISTNVQGPNDDDLGLMKIIDIVSEAKESKKKKKGANNVEDIKISANVHGSNVELGVMKANDGDSIVKVTIKEEIKSEEIIDEDEKIITYLSSVKGYKTCPKMEPIYGESSNLFQNVQDPNEGKPLKKRLIWISLVASENQKGDAPFPQVCEKYIKIEGGSPTTVSHVRKFLMKKLNLESEDEVEIICLGTIVPAEMQLQELAAWWFEKECNGKVMIWVGGTATEGFFFVLNYGRNGTQQVKIEK